MKKSKRILSALTALAISASAFASMVIPASAAEAQIGTTYTFDDATAVTAWTASGANNAEVSCADGTLKVLKNGSVNQGSSVSLAIPSAISPTGTDPVRVSFDWYSATTTGANTTEVHLRDGDKDTLVLKEGEGHKAIYVNGERLFYDVKAQWFTVSAVLDFETKRIITVTITPKTPDPDTLTAVTATDIAFGSTEAEKLDTLYVQGNRTSGASLASVVQIDNFAAYSVSDTYYKATMTVAPSSGSPVEGATVKLGLSSLAEDVYSSEYTTDANGQIVTKLPAGTYKYSISKPGCETATGDSTATGTFEITNAAVTPNVVYGPKTYTAEPDQVTISGGQSSLTAPRTAAGLSTTNDFAVTVVDQEGVTRDDADIVWSIAPADSNVEINSSTGVVTVKKGFSAGETHIKEFTVTATATLNSKSKAGTAKIQISDYLFFDSGIGGTSYGDDNSNTGAYDGVNYPTHPSSQGLTSITLPEPIEFTNGSVQKLSFKTLVLNGTGATFQRVLFLVDSEHKDEAVSALNGGSAKTKTSIMAMGLIGTTLGNSDTATWSSKDTETKFSEEYGSISTSEWTNVSIQFITNNSGDTTAKLTVGDKVTSLGTVAADDIAAIQMGQYMQSPNRYPILKDIIVEEVDPNIIEIEGPATFSSVAGATIEKEYSISAAVVESDETFNWTTTITGATITADAEDSTKAVLSVPGTVTSGGTITATSSKTPAKTATTTVTIAPATVESYDFEGSSTIDFTNGASTAQYSIKNVKDQYGDDITAYVNPEWSLKGREAVTLPKATFTVDASVAGDAVAIFPVYEGTALKSVTTAPVKITGTSVDIEGKNGQKVLLWNSLDGIQPLDAAKTITGDDVTTVNYITNTGTLNINVKQDETVVATILGTPIEKTVTVADFSKFVTPDDAGEISVADIVTYGATSFNVVLDDGTVIEKTAADNKITLAAADFEDTSEAEIIPNYKFNLGAGEIDGYTQITKDSAKANGYGLTGTVTDVEGAGTGLQAKGLSLQNGAFEVDIPDGMYDFKFYKAETGRANILVSGYKVADRVDMYAAYSGYKKDGDNYVTYAPVQETISTPAVYEAKNVVVEGGVAKITVPGEMSYSLAGVEITKNSEFVPRKTHIWLGGDSTVCTYYPEETKDDWAGGIRRTGWGQLFDNYLSDDVIVDNFAEAGNYAKGWYGTFGSVIHNAQKGDYVLIQFGINDQTYSKTSEMTEYLDKMVQECYAKGVTPVLITPQHSIQKWGDDKAAGPSGGGNEGFRTAIKDYCSKNNVLLIDLGGITKTWFNKVGYDYVSQNYYLYDALYYTYDKNNNVYNYAPQVDNLHLGYQGAKKCAEFVAQSIAEQKASGAKDAKGNDFSGIPVNASTTYQFTGGKVTTAETVTAPTFNAPSAN